MNVILVACVLVAIAGPVTLLLRRFGRLAGELATLAGLGSLANLVAMATSLLVAAGFLGQSLVGHGSRGDHAVVVACLNLVAALVCAVVLRVTTKPHAVPKHVDGWRPPASSTESLTMLLYDVRRVDGGLLVEAFTRSGRLRTFTSALDEQTCRELVDHQVVALVSTDGTDRILELIDLGTCRDEPITGIPQWVGTAPVATLTTPNAA